MTDTTEMPLFPLNTVLFPGMPLNLHIFEPRYKLMIGECIRDQRPFGVVLIESGSEVGGSSTIHKVGTAAYITQVRRYDNGEMDISTLGRKRFVVEEVSDKKPYLLGQVRDYPLDMTDSPRIKPLAAKVSEMVQKYLDIFATLGNVEIDIDELPKEPIALAFLAAVVLHMPMKDKQSLLTVPDLLTLLKLERVMLTREAIILKELIENGEKWRDDSSPFSPN